MVEAGLPRRRTSRFSVFGFPEVNHQQHVKANGIEFFFFLTLEDSEPGLVLALRVDVGVHDGVTFDEDGGTVTRMLAKYTFFPSKH